MKPLSQTRQALVEKRICMRCGADEKKTNTDPCYVGYGTSYKRHCYMEESMKQKVSEWEKEFDSKYLVLEQWTGLNAGSPPVDLRNDVKAFIQQTLNQQKAEFVEMVMGLEKEPTKEELNWMSDYMENEPNNKYKNGYNQALKDVVKKVGER